MRLFVWAALAAAGSAALLASSQTGPRRVALVIGNDGYLGQAVLQNARRDAAAMAAELRSLGFQTTLVEDTTRRRFDTAVEAFVNALTPNDIAIFYYAGHGAQADGENYLIPVDYDATSDTGIALQGVAASTIQSKLARARVSILVLDACRTNLPTGTRSGNRGLAAMEKQGSLVAFAAGVGQAAGDNPGGAHGTFMTALLDVMRVPGLSVREVFFQVRRKVYDVTGGRQWPAVYDNLLADVVLRPASAEAPAGKLVSPPPVPTVNPHASPKPGGGGPTATPGTSPPPAWMIGDFRGLNPGTKANVEITVHADGRITGFVNPQSGQGTPVQYVWVAATNQIADPTGAYTFDVERVGDAFRTRQVGASANTVTYRRMFLPPTPPAAAGARAVAPDAPRRATPDELAAMIAVVNEWKPAWERADEAAGRVVYPSWTVQTLRAERAKRGVEKASADVTCDIATVRRDQASLRCRAAIVEEFQPKLLSQGGRAVNDKPQPRRVTFLWMFTLVWNGTTWLIENLN